jgi:hypothetical protein
MYAHKASRGMSDEERQKWIACVENAVLMADGHCQPIRFERIRVRNLAPAFQEISLKPPPFVGKLRKKRTQNDTTEKAFRELVEKWRAGTAFISSLTRLAMHPAYQQIIGMGRAAIPLLLRELQSTPDHWFWALTAITGENPVNEKDAGNLQKMAETWIEWGRQRNYV